MPTLSLKTPNAAYQPAGFGSRRRKTTRRCREMVRALFRS